MYTNSTWSKPNGGGSVSVGSWSITGGTIVNEVTGDSGTSNVKYFDTAYVQWGPGGTGQITYHITGFFPNCFSQSPKNVTISTSPTLNAGFSYSGGSGGSYFFTDSSTLASSWSWDFGDGNTSSGQNPTHTYLLPGSYVVQHSAFSNCSSQTTSDTIVVTCSSYPSTVANFTTSDSTICLGESVSFTDLSVGPITNWFWEFSGGTPANSSLQTPSAVSYNTPGSYSVSLTTTSCLNMDTLTKLMHITVTDTPYVNNLGNDTTICFGDSILLIATGNFSSLLWNDGATSSSNFVGQNTSSQLDTIWVEAQINYCSSRDTLIIQKYPTVSLDFGADQTLCPGDTSTLMANFPGASYLWQNGSTGPTFDVTQAGVYHAQISHVCGTVSDTINVYYDSSTLDQTQRSAREIPYG